MAIFRKQQSALLVGVFATLAFGAMIALLLIISSKGPGLDKGYRVTVHFSDGSGVIEGSLVRMSGAVIGEVSSGPQLLPDYTGVEVGLTLLKDVAIPVNSEFRITSVGMLGDSFILIDPPAPDQRSGMIIAAGATVEGKRGGLDLAQLSGRAESLATETELTASELRARLEELEITAANVNASSESLRQVLDRLNHDYLSAENASAWNSTLGSASRTSANLERSSERLPGMLDRLDATLARADRAASSIENAAAEAEALMTEARPAVADFRVSLTNAGRAADELADTLGLVQGGDGLIAALLTDPVLKQDFHDLIFNLRESGVLFYGDAAGKQREREAREQERQSRRWQKAIESERER